MKSRSETDSIIKRVYILDEETKFLHVRTPSYALVLTHDELSVIDECKEEVEIIIILAELEWDGRYLQNFYGIALARQLRIEKSLLCPIVIVSTLSDELFLRSLKAELDFFKSPGLYYLSMSEWMLLDSFIESTESIDDLTLLDIAEDFGDLAGIIRSFDHDIKNRFLNFSVHKESVVAIEKLTQAEFRRLTMYFKGSEELIELIRSSFIERILKPEEPETVIKDTVNSLLRLIPGEKLNSELQQYEAKWKILFLDDQEESRNYLSASFQKRGLTCVPVASLTELNETLKEDERNNFFTVLICDYRLYLPNGFKRHHKQGYAILKEVFQDKPNYLSLFALSSMGHKVLLKFREKYGMRVWSFDKNDIKTEAGFNILTRRVFEEGERMFDTRCNLLEFDPKDPASTDSYKSWFTPDGTKRDKPYNYYYRQFLLSEEYDQEDERIGNEALSFYYKIIDQPVQHIYQFQTSLTLKKSQATKLKEFKVKLIGRRVYLALRYKSMLNPEEAWRRMQSGIIDSPTPDLSNLFASHLCMPEDFEKSPIILPEEKHWLKNSLGFDLDNLTRDAVLEVFSILKDYWDDEEISGESFILKGLAERFKQRATSITDLEKILRLICNVNEADHHIAAIRKHLKSTLSNIRRASERGNPSERVYARNLIHKFATAGILDLLDRFGMKPPKTRADAIRLGTNVGKDSKDFDFETDFDPSSPEGRSRLKDLESNP